MPPHSDMVSITTASVPYSSLFESPNSSTCQVGFTHLADYERLARVFFPWYRNGLHKSNCRPVFRQNKTHHIDDNFRKYPSFDL